MKTTTTLLVLLLGAPVFAVPLSVAVVDDQGAPVAGADVQLESFIQKAPGFSVAQTGADGQATFEVEPPKASIYGDFVGRLAVFKSGFALGGGALNLKKPAKITLAPAGAPISGTVVDASKKPVAGAQVSLSYWRKGGSFVPMFVSAEGPFKDKLKATTDAQGKWTLGNLPPDVTASTSVFAPGFARAQGEVASGASVQTTLHVGARVRGRLLGLDGQPLPDVRVFAQPRDNNRGREGYGEGTTAKDGTFDLDGLEADTYNVMFQTTDEAPYVVAAQEGVAATVGAPVQLPDSRAVEGVQIGGKVVERGTGKGVAGVQIGIYGGANPASSAAVSSATTDKDGQWTKRTLPGAIKVYVMGAPPEFVREQNEQKLELGPTGKNDFHAELSRATKIVGRLVDENGKGVKTSSLVLRQSYEEFPILSDDNGDFSAFGPKNGEVEIGRSRWNMGEQSADEKTKWDVVGTSKFSVPAVKPFEIKLKPAQLSSLELGVFDQNDEAVAGAKITVNISSGTGDNQMMQPRELMSDKTGRVHLDDIRSDESVSLERAAKDGFDPAPLPKIEKLNGVYRADITLTKRGGSAQGDVLDATGKVVASAQLFGSGVESVSDAAGHFSLAPLPSAKTDIIAWKDDGFALGSSDQTRLQLRPQTLEPSDPARAKTAVEALREETKNTKYWRRDSLGSDLGGADFDTSAAAVQAGGEQAIYGLITRFGADESIAPEKWIALLQGVKKPVERLSLAGMWASKRPSLTASEATRGFLDSLLTDATTLAKPNGGGEKWQTVGAIFGAAAFAEKIDATDAANTLFGQGQAFVLGNFAEKPTDRNSSSQDDILAGSAELIGFSPRLLTKLVEQLEPGSGGYIRALSGGAPHIAAVAGLDAAKPFLDKLKNSPPPKPDAQGNTPSLEWETSQAITDSIKAGGQSNPKLALELAQSLSKNSDMGNDYGRDRALCEAAFFQPPEAGQKLWRESLPRLEPSMAMRFITRIAQNDEPLARGFYETVRQNLDAQPDDDPNAMIYGRARQIAAFAFYEAHFAPARARYRLEKGFWRTQKEPNGRYELAQYAKAMAVFDTNRALKWADQIGNEDNNGFAGFEAKRHIARWLSLDNATRRKANFGDRYGRSEEDF